MTTRIILSIALTLSTGLMSGTPLSISDVVTGTASHVRIRNTTHQPVTAWSLAAVTEPVEGRVHREIYTTDGYLSELTHGLPRAAERLERLMPGESRELPLDPLPEGGTVEVIAAVLDDGTAFGEEAAVASIFKTRVKERDALKTVVDAFNAVLPQKRGADALSALNDRLTTLVERDDNMPCHAALDSVQAYEKTAGSDRIDAALRTYAAFVTREYELAVKHAERRGHASTTSAGDGL